MEGDAYGMMRVGKFEKVSYERFKEDLIGAMPHYSTVSDGDIRRIYDAIELPSRATSGSAGYDIHSPLYATVLPGEAVKIPTGIRVMIEEGWFLGCLPRSGMGFKYFVRLANTMGVIDSDYYGSSNEGHIFVKLVNGGEEAVYINKGDSFAQAIFLPFGITYEDDATGERDGGFGSTGR